MNLYFDESGFTGYNLLDPQQPYFVIASSTISSEVAEDLLRTSFPNYLGTEYKFNKIINSRNQAGLTTFGNMLSGYLDNIFLYCVDKRFAVFAKMVDFLLEPSITESGYDFYADGFCRKITNYIHFGLTVISKVDVYDDLLQAYMHFSRAPSQEGLNLLSSDIRKLEDRVEDLDVKPFLSQMADGAHNLTRFSDLEDFRSTNDIHLTTMIAIIGHWRQRYTDDFFVYHDASSHFLRQRETWQAVTNQEVPRQIHQLGDGTYLEYPLRVITTTSVDSANDFAIQLCDILAGFGTAYSRLNNNSEFSHPLYEIGVSTSFGQLTFNGLAPGKEFPEFPPKRKTGFDAVDLMTRIILSSSI